MSGCWEILGIRQTRDVDSVKRAYRDLMKRYHPDRVESPERKQQYTQKCAAINAAFQAAIDYCNSLPEFELPNDSALAAHSAFGRSDGAPLETKPGIHPVTWMALGGGGIAFATFVAAMLGFFRGPEQPPAVIPRPVIVVEAPRVDTQPPVIGPTVAAASENPRVTVPASNAHHPEIRDDAPQQAHDAANALERIVAAHGRDPSKWDPATRDKVRAYQALARPYRKDRNGKDAKVIAATVAPSVVTIKVFTENFEETGSGFVVGRDGAVVSNFHVVSHESQRVKSARVVFDDGTAAAVIGFTAVAPSKDLVLLRIDSAAKRLEPLPLAKLLPVQGETVYAFGSPLGFKGTMVDGTVSAVRKGDEVPKHDVSMTWIQTSAQISQGNSGGPLVNVNGEVIGVNTLYVEKERELNFAVSAVDVASLLAESGQLVRPLDELPGARLDGRLTREETEKRRESVQQKTLPRTRRQKDAAAVARNLLHYHGSLEKMPPKVREEYAKAVEAAGGAFEELQALTSHDSNATRDDWRRLSMQMTFAEVKDVLGEPSERTNVESAGIYWTYSYDSDSEERRRAGIIHFVGGKVHDWRVPW